jgi:cell division transport system permease protein
MKSWLRLHRYALTVTLRRLMAQPFSSLANLLVMALALALPLLGASILVSSEPIARQVSVTPEVTLFLKTSAPKGAANTIAQRLNADHADQLQAVRVVSRDDALKSLRNDPAWNQALAALPDNPLPDAVIVTLTEGDNFADRANRLAQTWKKWEHVDLVQLDSAWVQRLEAILNFARVGLIFLATCVAAVVLAAVFNTVRMQAMLQREEIAVARLVGATESFVHRPFLYLGALSGALAAILSIGVAAIGLSALNSALLRLVRSYGADFSLHLPSVPVLILAVIGTGLLGAIAARWSVTRSTRF